MKTAAESFKSARSLDRTCRTGKKKKHDKAIFPGKRAQGAAERMRSEKL